MSEKGTDHPELVWRSTRTCLRVTGTSCEGIWLTPKVKMRWCNKRFFNCCLFCARVQLRSAGLLWLTQHPACLQNLKQWPWDYYIMFSDKPEISLIKRFRDCIDARVKYILNFGERPKGYRKLPGCIYKLCIEVSNEYPVDFIVCCIVC